MSDSSEDEDLSRFKEAVDTSFITLIDKSLDVKNSKELGNKKPKSERYLEISSHYNDVKVPEEMQKQIGAKISAIIQKNIKFIDIGSNDIRERKIEGGVKLFKKSEGLLSCEDVEDTHTKIHNIESKKIRKKKRKISPEENNLNDLEKSKMVAVSGEYILSKEEIKYWKSRRKEKLFKYKSLGKSKTLLAVE